jgi:dTDP-4-dehydrorhamnose 3,5-epimerase-like enzyme
MLIEIKQKSDDRGDLSVIEKLPFKVKRVYWIKGNNKKRGEHAHHKTTQCLICIKGKCKINLDDGKEKSEILLDTDKKGLIVKPYIWHSMEFENDSILLILASKEYKEKDYIRDYNKFLKAVKR